MNNKPTCLHTMKTEDNWCLACGKLLVTVHTPPQPKPTGEILQAVVKELESRQFEEPYTLGINYALGVISRLSTPPQPKADTEPDGVVKDFLEGTPEWYKAFKAGYDTSQPCPLCGIKPDQMMELHKALSAAPKNQDTGCCSYCGYEEQRGVENKKVKYCTWPGCRFCHAKNKDTQAEGIDELIRDITKVGFMPKSEARRRIQELIAAAEERGRQQFYDDLDKLLVTEHEGFRSQILKLKQKYGK